MPYHSGRQGKMFFAQESFIYRVYRVRYNETGKSFSCLSTEAHVMYCLLSREFCGFGPWYCLNQFKDSTSILVSLRCKPQKICKVITEDNNI